MNANSSRMIGERKPANLVNVPPHVSTPSFADLIDEQVVANQVGSSRRTVQRWRCEGTGPPYFKLNGMVRYSPDVVRAWIAARATMNTAERMAREAA